MKIIAKYPFILLTLILFNCKQKEDTKLNLNGYYGMSNYFQSKNTSPDYIETFLLKIDTNKIKIYGTVTTWGTDIDYKFNKTKDTLLVENGFKIYRKLNSDDILYFETHFNNKIDTVEFKKIPNIETIMDAKGINSNKLSNFLSQMILVGKYSYKNKTIHFKENGKVENLENFSNYKIKPRIGTNTYYDDRIIETEKGIWKYEKSNGNLILTKYSTKRDKNEMFILSDEKIVLEKITQ